MTARSSQAALLGEHVAKLEPADLAALIAAAGEALAERTDLPPSFKRRWRSAYKALKYHQPKETTDVRA